MADKRTLSSDEKKRLLKLAVSRDWLIVPLLWVAFLGSWLSGYDLLSFKRDVGNKSLLPLGGLTVLCTVFYAVWVPLKVRSYTRLATRGKVANGLITGMDAPKPGVASRVNYQYEVEGRMYAGRADVDYGDCKDFEVGGPIELIVDPSKPSLSVRLRELYPHGALAGR